MTKLLSSSAYTVMYGERMYGERIMRTGILDRFVIESPPQTFLWTVYGGVWLL